MSLRHTLLAALALTAAVTVSLVATDGLWAQRAATTTRSAQAVPGGAVHSGSAIATMADQYNRPRPGAVAAAGASAWVPAPPPPKFVLSDPTPAPAAPPPAPPAAAANRQPAPAPAAPSAADIVRPEAAQPEPQTPAPAPAAAAAPAGLSAANLTKARQLFLDQSCGACHALANAGSSGGVGPALDGNPNLTRAHIITTVKEGRGPMPGFAASMEDADIGLLADYLIQVARK